MRRLYCHSENIEKDKIHIDEEGIHYLKGVLRLKKGDKIEIFDGKGNKYNCVLQDVNNVKIISKEFSLAKENTFNVTLVQAIPNKPSKMDFIIEKATELGVDAIMPVAAERSVVNVGANGRSPLRKIERWQKIASEASRQCGRSKVPEIKEVLSAEKALAAFSKCDLKLFACIDKDAVFLRSVLEDFKCRGNPCGCPDRAGASPAPTIAVFIGPEGDFTPREIVFAKESGFQLVSLGERVLRTETAGLYILSVLDYENI